MGAFNSEDDELENYGNGESWTRGKLLGEGNFGSVYVATSKRTSSYPSEMAVKTTDDSCAESLRQEWSVLRTLKGCSSVIQCFGAEATLKSDGYMAYNLLLEYCSGGSLSDKIVRAKSWKLPELEVRWYTRSILEGLVEIHEAGFVHCNLKPANILLFPISNDEEGRKFEFQAKICDLGLAKSVKEERQKRKTDRDWKGTPWYYAPEEAKAAEKKKIQGPPADIWSLGIMVLEMLTGLPAWDSEGRTWNGIRNLHLKGCRPKVPQDLSPMAKSFLKSCLRRRAKKRATAKKLLRHPFMAGLKNPTACSID